MTNTAEQLDVEELPAGGIGDFIMSDEDFRVLERQNAEKEYGSQGIARFEETASRIAAYGRFGDDQVVHVETGELVVPRKLIEQSPELKESIFRHLREAGIEDPERYVVGSAENSINPETGLMEFGFFSKIFKGIKKAVKKIGKVLKKAAPLILAIAAPYALPAMAPAFATALGSGVGTLIQGGSLKDAFKSALLAGGTYGVFSGAQEAMGGGSFAEGFGGAFKAPELVTPTVTDLSMTPERIDALGEGSVLEGGELVNTEQALDAARTIDKGSPVAPILESDVPTAAQQTAAQQTAAQQTVQTPTNVASTPVAGSGTVGENLREMFDFGQFGSKKTFLEAAGDLFMPVTGDIANYLPEGVSLQNATTAQVEAAKLKMAEAGLSPGFFRRYAPAATVAATLGGFFKTPPVDDTGLVDVDEEGNVITGQDLIDENPYNYRIYPQGYTTATYVPPPDALVPYQLPPRMAAEGGEIFPRRTGGIMPDEGIPNEDSVKAMLMPGEFVMTTTAVRGLGDGDLKKGINNMYSVMRNLEARGRATA
jgi:hypothetical protein